MASTQSKLAETTDYQYNAPMEFEWDDQKAAENLRKHAVAFEAAVGVFADPFALEAEDMSSNGEQRFNRIGMSEGRLLFVTYTWRGEVCRIISARRTTASERRHYHETQD